MTEEAAMKKWCPFVRAPEGEVGSGIAVNRYIDRGGVLTDGWAVTCIASNCMAWRWEMIPIGSETATELGQSETEGYCGLAGKLGVSPAL